MKRKQQQAEAMGFSDRRKGRFGMVIKMQDGLTKDSAGQLTAKECKNARIPVAVAAMVKGRDAFEMAQEAVAFWGAAKDLRPTFWWLVVDQVTMPQMRDGLDMYTFYLRAFGAERVGLCTSQQLYGDLRINPRKFDGHWIKYRDVVPDGSWEILEQEDPQRFACLFGKQNKLPRKGEQWRFLTEPKQRKKGAKRR